MDTCTRRDWLKAVGAGALALAAGRRAWAAPPTPPNILFLLIDDLGWSEVSYNGGSVPTPHCDKLCASGAKLTDHYVMPVCSPTRTALLTGRYPMRTGLHTGVVRPWAQYGLPLEERTLAQALKAQGYQTSICGKWHLGHFKPEYLPLARGFDHQYGHYNGALDYFKHTRDGGFDWHRDGKECRDEGYSTELVAREVQRLMRERDRTRPSFWYVPFNAVHAPIQSPEAVQQRFPQLPKRQRALAGLLAAMDDAVGAILRTLDAEGLRDNTLIVFSSDNGGPRPNSNGRFRGHKGTLYEGGVRVAACASWAGRIPAGSTVKAPLHAVDWYPTFVKLAGGSLDQPLRLDGRDILPCLTTGAPSPHEELLLNTTPTSGALRVGEWKLVLGGAAVDVDEEGGGGAAAPGGVELFNLADDPFEQRNLAKAEPARVKELRARLEVYAKQAATPKYQPKPAPGFRAPAVWGEPG